MRTKGFGRRNFLQDYVVGMKPLSERDENFEVNVY